MYIFISLIPVSSGFQFQKYVCACWTQTNFEHHLSVSSELCVN